jgi:hypothetical protein
MRPEIREQRVADPTKAFCPGMQAVFTVNRDTQDLGIYPLEPVKCDLVRGDLRRSYRRPGQREEGQDDIFSTQIIAQANFLAAMIYQGKVRGILPYSQRHFIDLLLE